MIIKGSLMRILLLLLLVACGTDTVIEKVVDNGKYPDYYSNFDPDFHEHIYEYEKQAASQNKLYTVKGLDSFKMVKTIKVFNKDGVFLPSVIGVCRTFSNGSTHIEIESGFYYYKSEVEAKGLVFHELGHCVQKSDHRDELDIDKCPSIMATYVSSRSKYSECWNNMIVELFSDRKLFDIESYSVYDDCIKQPDGSLACF